MQITKEGYLLTRSVERVERKPNKFIEFIGSHKLMLAITASVSGLLLAEIVLIKSFVDTLGIIVK